MAPVTLKRLIAGQRAREQEMDSIGVRLRKRGRDTLNRKILQTRFDAVTEIWSGARETHAEIVARDDAEQNAYIVENLFAHMQTRYEDTLDYISTLITEFEITSERAVRVRQADVNIDNLDPRPAKLPKLDLPKFSGRYEDWESFCDLFTTLVHNAPRVADATKLQYLKTCLSGPAADLLSNVGTTNANYVSTWLALKTRYDKPRLIVSNHLNALMNMVFLKKESAVELRSFADEAQRIVRALANLKMPVMHWDIWFVHILSARLDPDSKKAWESELNTKDRRTLLSANREAAEPDPLAVFPKFTEFTEFLERRSETLTMISVDDKNNKAGSSSSAKPQQGARKAFHTRPSGCALCSEKHYLAKCAKFLALSSIERRTEIRRLRLCFNCMGPHMFRECKSKGRCGVCKGAHHSLLHHDSKARSQPNPGMSGHKPQGETAEKRAATTAEGVKALTAGISVPKYSVILATAQVKVVGPNGTYTNVRALLDQGSEASFVSEAVVQLLGLRRRRVRVPLTGLGACAAGTARFETQFTLKSLIDPDFTLATNALVLPCLTSQLPARSLIEFDFNETRDLALADPLFHIPASVDLILGADVYGLPLRSGLQNISSLKLTAQDTALGWIISGALQPNARGRAEFSLGDPLRALHCASEEGLHQTLQKFWTLEEIPRSNDTLKPDEQACERQFIETHRRDTSGRYIVHLPLKGDLPEVAGETRRIALGSLAHMHRRFSRDSKLAQAYRDFMETYERLGHMTRIPPNEVDNPRAWYLPHHAVVQSTPSNWKIRVVFDASRRTHEQHCLNDFLRTGPPLQQDLPLILLNWCQYRFVFTADIVKMFRQIGIIREEQDLHRIIWASHPGEAPVEYRLTTVTYGTACAPYLAIRTLAQLAIDEGSRFPLGADCLKSNTYVDDIFVGADDPTLAVRKRMELVELLHSAGIDLDKWASNHADLLPSRVPYNANASPKQIDHHDSVKTLGIHWNPTLDDFRFNALPPKDLTRTLTKRSVLSNIARLFDPLGWLSPITVTAKILMQDLWILKCEWDAELPSGARNRWIEYCDSLASLPEISISRWLGLTPNLTCQIHGYADASSRAYAAVIYLRIDEGNGRVRVALLAAKSKVAPVKTVSIPNLELCGAVLLVKLVSHLRKLDFLKAFPMFLWSDSQIVLTWLSKHPCHWKTFVANRVSLIQTELPSAVWAHVPTADNPADIATRGCKPVELKQLNLWWQGPSWLSLRAEEWPRPTETVQTIHAKISSEEPDILSRFASLTRLIDVVAYCLRPLVNLRRRKGGLNPLTTSLTSSELAQARVVVIRLAQSNAFATEIDTIKHGKLLPKHNPLRKLNPFWDKEDKILRVGGRLSQSKLARDSKHPPILPRRSELSRLFVRYAHSIALHGGPTLTSNVVLQHVWILGRKQLVKTVIRYCVKCQRVKPRLAHQLMGDLPAARITPARPFTTSGLDYAGPFQVRTTKGRGHRAYKGYIVLFICFVTRAIHLELVSDLTTASFIAAYRRFVSRRGMCRHLYSDNATTFRGADIELREMFDKASRFYQDAATAFAKDGTTWTFIPPTTPHYGGIWEAGVKSVKHHLKRVIGEHTLTFEEFSTVLAEVEACLNSRPLRPLSSDVEDLSVLTPAHFLIGSTSGLIPDEEPPSVPENRLDRFQLMQKIRNQFWKQWSNEYLQQLQERGKWRDPTVNFKVGQLVLLRDDRYPPAKWPLGRVLETHQGPDGLVRVVTVKTATNTFRRHIARLCPLALEAEEHGGVSSPRDGSVE